jgi:hypothetical protein
MNHDLQPALVDQVLAPRRARLDGATLVLHDGRRIGVPQLPTVAALTDMPSALPSRARGDSREKLLYNVAQDLSGLLPSERQPEAVLWDSLGDRLGADRTSQQVLSAVMRKQYRVEPVRRAGATGSPFLTPFHATLPGAYDYHGRYKSFRGSLLLFLCWDGTDFDTGPVDALAQFLSSADGLTLLDRELVRVAEDLIQEAGKPTPRASSSKLISAYGEEMRERLGGGTFDLPGLERMRRDLQTVLDLKLPRHDKVAALVQGLSINLALYYYRLAYTLGAGIDACTAAAAGGTAGPAPDFTGRLLFRVGSGGDRPVRMTEPCSQSFLQLDARYLLALPASMVVANCLHLAGAAAGILPAGSLPDPHGLAVQLETDPAAREAVDALAALFALSIAPPAGSPRAAQRAAATGSGCYALREASLDSFRSRGSALKQRGRDVVHTLVGGYVGGLKRSRGPVSFFELDEAVLDLLVELTLAAAGSNRLNFRDAFLPALAEYGLKPQDSTEEALLAEALERLGLLRRYSDAGEALYVSNA